MKLALGDVKVIEYGDFISVPYCGKLLADLGAEVIKVEKPGEGDRSRKSGPFLDDTPGSDRGGLFLYLNSNKLGTTLNLESAVGRKIFKELIKNADILLEDGTPGKMSALGLGYEELSSVNAGLVMTSVTPFGQTGPYKNYKGSDLVGWHMGGIGYVTPRVAVTPGQEPMRVTHMADFIAGLSAAVATMSALHAKRRTGLGQQVDLSQLETVVTAMGYLVMTWPYDHRSNTRDSSVTYAPQHFVRCKDGWLLLFAIDERPWRRFIEMMGNPEWADVFADRNFRGENWESLRPLIEEWTMKHTKAELFQLAMTYEVPLGPANSIAELLACAQLKERDFFAKIDHPLVGRLTYPGAPYKLSETPWALRLPAPILGQHNRYIYCGRLGYSGKELRAMRAGGVI